MIHGFDAVRGFCYVGSRFSMTALDLVVPFLVCLCGFSGRTRMLRPEFLVI